MKYLTPADHIQHEIEIKRSRFIAHIAPACHRAAAEEFISKLKKQHPQSNHVCWAYIAGPPNTTIMSMSDDGEPSGTAGKPILNILTHSGLGEIVVAVVRYFGGTKLRTGGLQRAYSNVVSETIDKLSTTIKTPLVTLSINLPYSLESEVRHILQMLQGSIEQCLYKESITIQTSIPEENHTQCVTQINNRTAGKATIKQLAPKQDHDTMPTM